MGLSAEWEDIDKAHAQMRSTGEPNFSGETNYLIASCEKWLGSHAKMLEFAQNAYATSLHPSLAGLIAEAHFEKYFYLLVFEDEEDKADAYLEDDAVKRQILQASHFLLDACEGRSKYEFVEAHGYFACVFSPVENHEAAAMHYLGMGRVISRHPWEFFENSFLNQSRRKALASI